MGFNIGVSGKIWDEDSNCDKILDRMYFNWVKEYSLHGNQSCMIQTGNYFKLDLKPLTWLVYDPIWEPGEEWDDDDPRYDKHIQFGLQKTDFLLDLVSRLIKNVMTDSNFIDHINYKTDDDSTLWRTYVLKGEFLEHLKTLKESLDCYKSHGQDEVYFYCG